MSCDKDKLLLFWSKELSTSEMADMEKHLQTCLECRQEYEEMLSLAASFNSTMDEPAPCDFVAEASRQTRGRNPLFLATLRKPSVMISSLTSLAVAAAIMIALYSPLTSRDELNFHIKNITVSDFSLGTHASVKRHLNVKKMLAAKKPRFITKGSFKTRTALLKTKIQIARKRLTRI